MKVYLAQCRAELLRTLRNRPFVVFSIGLPLMFYFVFSNAVPGGESGEFQRYYLISMSAFSLVGSAINTFGQRLAAERSKGWSRLLQVTPMPPQANLAAKLTIQTLLNGLSLLILFAGAALLNGVQMTPGVWVSSFLWLLVGCIPFFALGAMLSVAMPLETYQVVGVILNLILALLGGLWMPMSVMPKVMQQIGDWMPTFRFASGGWNLVTGKAIDWTDVSVLAGYTLVFVVGWLYLERRQRARAEA